jgi:hypothetical protein
LAVPGFRTVRVPGDRPNLVRIQRWGKILDVLRKQEGASFENKDAVGVGAIEIQYVTGKN